MTVNALIADATPFVLLAVRGALEASGITVVAEASTAREAVAGALRTRPDVVLMDADLDPSMDALSVIASAVPKAALVVLAPAPSEEMALRAVRAGACGFLPKDTPPERLAAVVEGTLRGEAAIPRQLVRLLLAHLGHPATPTARAAVRTPSGLSVRERDVLRTLALGLSDRDAASRLGIAEVTVRRHVASAMHKLGVSVRDDALRMFDGRPAAPLAAENGRAAR